MHALVETIGYAVLALAFTGTGMFVELIAIEQYSAGQLTVGLWLAGFGAIALYLGIYHFAYGKVGGALAESRS